MAQKRQFKSKKKLTMSGDLKFRKWADYEEGDQVIGRYVGQHEDTTYGGTHWILQVLDVTTGDRKFNKEIIGKNLVLNSTGKLDKAMKNVEEGEIVSVTYEGKAKMAKGHKFAGKDAHQMTVELMEDEDAEDDSYEDEEEDDDSDAF